MEYGINMGNFKPITGYSELLVYRLILHLSESDYKEVVTFQVNCRSTHYESNVDSGTIMVSPSLAYTE